MKKLECNCGSKEFNIQVNDECNNCEYNGARFNSEWIYNPDKIKELGIERNQTLEYDECKFGTNWHIGCNMFKCSKCGEIKSVIPFVDC